MHDNFWDEAEQEELEQANGEPEACPVMSVFHHLQTITIELDITIKVHVMERLHRDLVPSAVLGLIGLILEGNVMFDRATRIFSFFVLAGSEGGCERPECE